MCLSNSDLLNFARRFEKLHLLNFFIFFYLVIPKTQAENFCSLYGIPNEDKQKIYIF